MTDDADRPKWEWPWPQSWGQVFGLLVVFLLGFPLKGAIGSGPGLCRGLAEAGARSLGWPLATGGREPLAQAAKGRCKDGGTTGWPWRARGQTSS